MEWDEGRGLPDVWLQWWDWVLVAANEVNGREEQYRRTRWRPGHNAPI